MHDHETTLTVDGKKYEIHYSTEIDSVGKYAEIISVFDAAGNVLSLDDDELEEIQDVLTEDLNEEFNNEMELQDCND